MEFSHELVMPNEDLPFKLFAFEGKDGKYERDKHWHRSVEIFALFEGVLDFYLNEQHYSLQSGEFMLVNSNEIHSIHARESNLTIVLQIPLKAFEGYFTGEQFIRFTHEPKMQDEKIMDLVQGMYDAYQEKKCGYDMKVQGLYYTLLYLLVTKYRELDVSADVVKQNRKLRRLSTITSYIKDNYTSELTLESLAEIFGYAPAYLSRMFQKYAGINYKSYLQSIRVECAYKELANTEHTVSEVAQNNGFPNSKALARVFEQKYGMLPSVFQKMKKTRK